MEELIITKAGPDQADRISALVQDTILGVYPRYYLPGAVSFFSRHHSRAHILRDLEKGRVWVLERGGALLGTVTLSAGEINRLFIQKEQRGKGYGSRLLDFAEAYLFRDSGTISLHAALPALSLYRRRGYRETSFHKERMDNGDWLCWHSMQLRREDRRPAGTLYGKN